MTHDSPPHWFQRMMEGSARQDRRELEQEYWDAVDEKYGLNAAIDRAEENRKREKGE